MICIELFRQDDNPIMKVKLCVIDIPRQKVTYKTICYLQSLSVKVNGKTMLIMEFFLLIDYTFFPRQKLRKTANFYLYIAFYNIAKTLSQSNSYCCFN